jgi:hypothetical protein
MCRKYSHGNRRWTVRLAGLDSKSSNVVQVLCSSNAVLLLSDQSRHYFKTGFILMPYLLALRSQRRSCELISYHSLHVLLARYTLNCYL